MLIENSLNLPHIGSKYTIAINGQYTYQYFCESNSIALEWTLYAYEGLILLLCTKVCYDTRSIPDAINEAASIAKIIFSVVLLILIVFTIDVVSTIPKYALHAITGVAFFIYNLVLFVFYFGPKCYLLLMGADLDRKMQLVWPEKKKEAGKVSVKIIPTTGKWQLTFFVCKSQNLQF